LAFCLFCALPPLVIKRAAGRSRYSNPTTHSTIATSASLALDSEFPRPKCPSFSASTLIQSENVALGSLVQLNRKPATAPGAACALCCAPFSPFNCKQHSRTQQRHCTRQRAAKQAAPRAAKKLARDSSTARGNALNHHTQPRAQKNSSRTAAAPNAATR
jgi:hypothetical protein